MAEIVHEVRSAVAWLYFHGEPFGIDPARIFIIGSSAGAHLCSSLVSEGWHNRYRLPEDAIKGVLAMSGIYDFRLLCDIFSNEWLHLSLEQAKSVIPIFLCLRKPLRKKFYQCRW
ncbi:alpha/beta hydrolase [Edwardsiella anguillarum]|uniref:alpha/beta hydrolase n=1 Tax=Edwardsiella anguillarum TaxID=1821960 RepID=UPI0024B7FCF8|nr:alpha/beta hydrolase [Edwardsiella anguillarum]WHP79100.1 alpha/beta hydrolase [Edwardsiella anguillarum]WHQ16558.1 alpha/beta hydrolase [Edwardsiella anguillarum]WHQ20093.1 alpha/beta hydrolase [Edwardsiella anguillarum]WHQ23614.1 alpha/beta hydrolase [Edwardsiella anguillarum]WHQ27185.1 alpha/beta hydrolase [Edwardsiella anguillarum]